MKFWTLLNLLWKLYWSMPSSMWGVIDSVPAYLAACKEAATLLFEKNWDGLRTSLRNIINDQAIMTFVKDTKNTIDDEAIAKVRAFLDNSILWNYLIPVLDKTSIVSGNVNDYPVSEADVTAVFNARQVMNDNKNVGYAETIMFISLIVSIANLLKNK